MLLRASKKSLKPWRINANATLDHNVPTTRDNKFSIESIKDNISKLQVVELDKNCNDFGIKQFNINCNQGIVHVIGPELGLTLPEMSIVCGDSHTSTMVLLVVWQWNWNI